jgi:paraquat-inducible protein B
MTESKTDNSLPGDLPQAAVQIRKRQFSIVWLVPLVALLIGAWLVYKAFSEKGPTITITFQSAEGLEAGKTKIKYKDVELGQVETIDLSPDLSHVILTAELVPAAKKYLSKNTRFWVVRARVAAGAVSGLGTLFSGAYIGLDPGKPGKSTRHFKGLEVPPVVTTDLPGRHFVLMAPRLGSLDAGSPVYYRQIKVGQVEGYELAEDGQAVTVKIFIHAPYHQLVHKNTRFWNASGLDVAVDATGIRINTESFVTLMLGGLAFDIPKNLEPGPEAAENDVFMLYESRETINQKTYTEKKNWLLYFGGSVRGLAVGAPVEFRGIPIGKVVDVNLEFDTDKRVFRIPVLVEIERGHISMTGSKSLENERQVMDYLVEKGLRAQLKTGSLITGQLLVELDIYPEAPPARINWQAKYPELPTVPTPLEEITASLTDLLNKLGRLPLEDIGKHLQDTAQGASRLVNSTELPQALAGLNQTVQQMAQLSKQLNSTVAPDLQAAAAQLNTAMKQVQGFAESLNSRVAPKVGATLDQAQATLADVERAAGPDSAMYSELRRVLKELADAARSIRVFSDYLERHPDALIYGKGKGQ